ncbi:hypothetical protein CMUS01_05747 [Colletotrichum musicola]|uniref:Uncharacterized protein n=1 Tax=Colletotrichum musicola TaxID=2175873 RepID=A0A8H6KR36_9PEZI|nr:hypothetical protein CMUS01_05747 [Colletotrichum musicola]
MRVASFLSAGIFAMGALAQTSGSCCTSNSLGQVNNHNDQTQACCSGGRWDGTECWISNLDALTSCCRGKGSAMCSF